MGKMFCCHFKKCAGLCLAFWFFGMAGWCNAAPGEEAVLLQDFLRQAVSPKTEISGADSLQQMLRVKFSGIKNPQEYYRLRDLVDYVLFLKSRIHFYEQNNAMLRSFIQSAEDAAVIAHEPLARLKNDEENIFGSKKDAGRFVSGVSTESLEQIVLRLRDVESVLLARLKKMQVINDELRSLKIETLAYKRRLDNAHMKDTCLSQIVHLRAELGEKDSALKTQGQDIQDLRLKVDKLTLGMDVFRDRLQASGQKIDQLLGDVASTSLDLYQKELDAEEGRRRADETSAQLRETAERLQLVQHIIQEKDRHIQKLEEDILQIQSGEGLPSAEGSVNTLRSEMTDAVFRLQDEIAHSQEKIRRLEERFQDAALANAHLESEIMKKNLMVKMLEKQTLQKDALITDMESVFRTRARQLSELKGIVKIYQLKLREYKEALEERDRLINQFQTGGTAAGSDTVLQIPDSILWEPDRIRDIAHEELNRLER